MQHKWPELNYSEWHPTYETIHRWMQIVGKLRLCKTPWTNHSWHTTLYVTARGLSTGPIPIEDRILCVEFDFIEHKLWFLDSLGKRHQMLLRNETVASFFRRFNESLKYMEVEANFWPRPNELKDATPFAKDTVNRIYNPDHAWTCWQALIRVHNVFQKFRSNFTGKCSPVHFFWGSFDLAVSRFSGRTAPEHPGGIPNMSDEVVKEAYSHEVSSCGFWPGNEDFPHAAFYSYIYPEPEGFKNENIRPKEAFYHEGLREFILPYEAVRKSRNPEGLILEFMQSTYEAAANLNHWERDKLEVNEHLMNLKTRHMGLDYVISSNIM